MGDDPLDMASRTGRSCGTVGMDTGMMDLVWCPISGEENTCEDTEIILKNPQKQLSYMKEEFKGYGCRFFYIFLTVE